MNARFLPFTIKQIERSLELKLALEKTGEAFTGEELIYYIYAILYSNKFRKKYNDQLKYDFPTIPYPKNKEYFYALAAVGEKLFKLHLPDSYYSTKSGAPVIEELKTYKFIDDSIVLNGSYSISAFAGVGECSLGGYRPADKWLKDHKGESLYSDDIAVYKKIITAISMTMKLQDDVDRLIVL